LNFQSLEHLQRFPKAPETNVIYQGRDGKLKLGLSACAGRTRFESAGSPQLGDSGLNRSRIPSRQVRDELAKIPRRLLRGLADRRGNDLPGILKNADQFIRNPRRSFL
jgi:hypothetical protein